MSLSIVEISAEHTLCTSVDGTVFDARDTADGKVSTMSDGDKKRGVAAPTWMAEFILKKGVCRALGPIEALL
jgi:hypothetical protein